MPRTNQEPPEATRAVDGWSYRRARGSGRPAPPPPREELTGDQKRSVTLQSMVRRKTR